MKPIVGEPASGRTRPRLSDPDDVDFALRALLGPGLAGAAARAVAASRLPAAPTLAQVVEAACGHLGPSSRHLAGRLLDAYFHLDPPVPASGDARS